jgi:hypothetical protein
MFPFGYGLSYTSFSFSHLTVSRSTVSNRASGPGAASCDCNGQNSKLVTVSATVANTGKVAGADVAQLYLSDRASAGEPSRQQAMLGQRLAGRDVQRLGDRPVPDARCPVCRIRGVAPAGRARRGAGCRPGPRLAGV